MSIKIRDVVVKKGTKYKGFVKVAEASTHEIKMPYIIVNGEKNGHKPCVLGGVHPLEYASIEGVLKIGNSIDPAQLKGTLFILLVVNTDGFHAQAAFNIPIDYQNQNRVFSGDTGKTKEMFSYKYLKCKKLPIFSLFSR